MSRRTHPVLTIFLVLLAGSLCAAATTFTAKCIGVSDGDTIKVLHAGEPEKIRLNGIDCPEKSQAFGNKAKQYTSDLVFRKDIEVHPTGKDRYGRTLARVIVGGQDVSLQLVKAGLAWHYKQYSSDTVLANAEKEARAKKIGLWSESNPVPPWEYRKKR